MRSRSVRIFLGLAAISVFAASASAQAEKWTNDASHSGAYFEVLHMKTSNIRGSFHKMSLTMMYDPADLTKTTIDATIDAASIDTDVDARDKDLRSADYFDVEKYPTLTFKSKSVQAEGNGKLKLVGDLTIHGVTKEVAFDVSGPRAIVKDPTRGAFHMGATASTTIKRQDFGISINPNIGDDIHIIMELDLTKPSAPLTSSNQQ